MSLSVDVLSQLYCGCKHPVALEAIPAPCSSAIHSIRPVVLDGVESRVGKMERRLSFVLSFFSQAD